jgi:thymidine kinase
MKQPMASGKLRTITGPMYAGKTSAILQEILWIKHCDNNVLVIKPDIDNRYSNNHIETHNRLSFPCYATKNWQQVLDNHNLKSYNFHTVFLDEVQFMDTTDTLREVNIMLGDGVNVIAAGLNQDSRGQPFETTAMLLAISDEIKMISAICTTCGKAATKTQRLVEQGDRVEVGSVGMYEPKCLEHWTPK